MKKLFVFSDVHSFYDEFSSALAEKGFDIDDPDHVLVSLGDLCDRGPDSRKVLEFINGIDDQRKVLVIGNHELLMEDLIKRGYYLSHDKHNRTNSTVSQLTGVYGNSGIYHMRDNKLWYDYKKGWRWYFELDDYVFVHGYIPCGTYNEYGEQLEMHYDPDWRNAGYDQWFGACWANGMNTWACGIREEGKTIYCGHWHTSWGHAYLHQDGKEFAENEGEYERFDPFVDEGIVAIDACTAYTHKVNVCVLDINDEEYERWRNEG